MSQRFHKLVGVLFSGLILSACSPLGSKVEESISSNHYYNLFHSKIIYSPSGNWFNLGYHDVYGADVDSFKPISGIYAVDKDYVYCREHIIFNEKPSSFEYLGGRYARGDKGVYVDGKILEMKNPKNFHVNKYTFEDFEPEFGIGAEFVFDQFGRIISSDPMNFKYLEEGFFADSKNLYGWSGWKVKHIDVNTFSFIKDSSGNTSTYAKDKDNIYSMLLSYEAIEEADYESFQVVCTGKDYPELAKDKNHVYGYDRLLVGLSPSDYNYPETCEKYKGKAHID